MPEGESLGLSYVLPLRWTEDRGLAELAGYVRWLAGRAEVLIVDGSPPARFAAHAAAWGGGVRHLPPDPDLRFLMGKVNGVVTGLRHAAHELVVVADDDVRYDHDALSTVASLLAHADLVRPQNYFDPLPWHARWDTGRTLLNRALGADYPGTLGLGRALLLGVDGYDGNVMFENLELIRTVEALGGRETVPLDLFVRRIPPAAAVFLSQRVRQAYDDFAQPQRQALFLGLAPALGALARRRGAAAPMLAAGLCMVVAEVGRRRGGGRRVFPASASLLAPAWTFERAVCSWLALVSRAARGGIAYGDVVIPRAATPRRVLRRRLARAAVALRSGPGTRSPCGSRRRTA